MWVHEWSMINIRLIYTVIGVFYTLANANWELLLSIAVLNMHCMFVYRQNMCFRNFKHQQMVGWWLWGVILFLFDFYCPRWENPSAKSDVWGFWTPPWGAVHGRWGMTERGVNHGEPAFDPTAFLTGAQKDHPALGCAGDALAILSTSKEPSSAFIRTISVSAAALPCTVYNLLICTVLLDGAQKVFSFSLSFINNGGLSPNTAPCMSLRFCPNCCLLLRSKQTQLTHLRGWDGTIWH